MLGEQIVENERGKITSTRILTDNEVEVSFQTSGGRILGVEFNNTGTIHSSPGKPHGQGQGVATTEDGEIVTWTYQGVGKPTGRGTALSVRGSVLFKTASQKLARLNNLCAIVEAEFDENGNIQAKLWEWK